jgi:hypothetical protein
MGFLYTLSKVFHLQQGKATIGGEKTNFRKETLIYFQMCTQSCMKLSTILTVCNMTGKSGKNYSTIKKSPFFYYVADSDVKSDQILYGPEDAEV